MNKTKDMSTKNYNKLRAAEKGEKIDSANIYAKSSKTIVGTALAKGGATILHAHLRAIAQATSDDE